MSEPTSDIVPFVGRVAWEVPVEMAVSLAPPRIRKTVIERQARGEVLRQTANVTLRGDKYWAVLHWADGKSTSLPIDCWAGESRP